MAPDQPTDKGKGKEKAVDPEPEPEPSSDDESAYTVYSSEWHSDDSSHTKNEKYKIKKFEAASNRERLITLLSQEPSLHMTKLIEEHIAKHSALFKGKDKFRALDESLKGTKEERNLLGQEFMNNRDSNVKLLKELIKNYPVKINDLHNNPDVNIPFNDKKRK